MPNNTQHDFELERYKYILTEIRALNENLHKYLTLFQSLVTILVGSGVYIFFSFQKKEIAAAHARVGLEGVKYLLLISAAFILLSMISGILAWRDYRKEESELLDKVVAKGFRKMPTFKNFWRWYETWMIVFIFFVTLFLVRYIDYSMLPLVQ